jgi:GNAT superfamily N-acetyltransferase
MISILDIEWICTLARQTVGGMHGVGAQVVAITVQKLISTAEGGPVGLVEHLVVAEAHRGEEIGRRLLQAMETRARDTGFTRLQLLADSDNAPALDFYNRRGWRRTSLLALRRNS